MVSLQDRSPPPVAVIPLRRPRTGDETPKHALWKSTPEETLGQRNRLLLTRLERFSIEKKVKGKMSVLFWIPDSPLWWVFRGKFPVRFRKKPPASSGRAESSWKESGPLSVSRFRIKGRSPKTDDYKAFSALNSPLIKCFRLYRKI